MTKRMIFPFLLGLVGAVILVSLGTWQLQRLSWKAGIIAEIEARIGAAPVAVPANPDPVRDRFLPVTATGTITDAELDVLVSVKNVGPGYRIISAFETEDGRRILLDRGFVADARKGDPRPAVEATVTGNLHWPEEVDSFTPAPDLRRNIWFARDVPAMADALGTRPILLVLRERPPTVPDVTPWPVDTAGIPNDHLQYAMTWFSLAAIWGGMTLLFVLRARRKAKES
jgi:surfeit locus 1 family protein